MSGVKSERAALAALIVLLVGLPLAVLGYQFVLRPAAAPHRVVDVAAVAPEGGGFSPTSIEVVAGETVTLRFHAEDVTHGIAIGPGLGVDLGHIDPGHVGEVTLTFEEPGTYTYYCNTWCSPDHWRMRGVIEVRDPNGALPAPQTDPLIEALIAEGVDIDAAHTGPDHPAASLPGSGQPSAARGADALPDLDVPAELSDEGWRLTHTPAEALHRLSEANPDADPAMLADAAAALWVSPVVPQTVTLYEQNCAACHGQYGGGDGPAAGTTAETPAAFSDPAYMAAMRGDVLYAKIRRGGMGTDMPNFGTVFTQEETRALVEYLWVLAFGGE